MGCGAEVEVNTLASTSRKNIGRLFAKPIDGARYGSRGDTLTSTSGRNIDRISAKPIFGRAGTEVEAAALPRTSRRNID